MRAMVELERALVKGEPHEIAAAAATLRETAVAAVARA